MSAFLGTHAVKLDRKGRLSVPSAFRNALSRLGTEDLVLRPSRRLPCVEALPQPAFDAQARALDALDPFSEEREDLASELYADAFPMRPDTEGRVTLPDTLAKHAKLTDSLLCVGLGTHFQLWEPAAWAERSAALRNRPRGAA